MRLLLLERRQTKNLRDNAQLIQFPIHRRNKVVKIVFLLALLANIFFFFWEYNSATPRQGADISHSKNDDSPKQILLLSELNGDLSVAENTKLRAYPKPTVSESIEEGVELQELNNDDQEIVVSESMDEDLVTDLKNLAEESETDLKDLAKEIKQPLENSVVNISQLPVENKEFISRSVANDSPPPIENKLVYCYQVGPFENNDMLDKWSVKNKINKGSLQPFSKYNQEDARYLVYYPAAIDYEISKQNVQFFIDMGITDYWLFKTGNLKGAISLGLFAKAIDALALKEKFFNKGINVEIRESYSNASVLFARVLSIDESFTETAIMSGEQMVVDCE